MGSFDGFKGGKLFRQSLMRELWGEPNPNIEVGGVSFSISIHESQNIRFALSAAIGNALELWMNRASLHRSRSTPPRISFRIRLSREQIISASP